MARTGCLFYTPGELTTESIQEYVFGFLLKTLFLQVETLRSVVLQGRRRSTPIPDSKYPPWLAVELYRYYGFFALGACGCLLFTEVAK